jgi:hypothetical protein
VNPDGSGTDAGPAQQVVEEIKKMGGDAVANLADVSTMDGGESVIKSALDTYGKLDGLINLAAILRDRMVFNLTEEEWDDVIRVDLKGHFTTIKPAAVLMRQQRYGRIVNYSSVSGLNGNSGQANYGELRRGEGGRRRADARGRAGPRALWRDSELHRPRCGDKADGDGAVFGPRTPGTKRDCGRWRACAGRRRCPGGSASRPGG